MTTLVASRLPTLRLPPPVMLSTAPDESNTRAIIPAPTTARIMVGSVCFFFLRAAAALDIAFRADAGMASDEKRRCRTPATERVGYVGVAGPGYAGICAAVCRMPARGM